MEAKWTICRSGIEAMDGHELEVHPKKNRSEFERPTVEALPSHPSATNLPIYIFLEIFNICHCRGARGEGAQWGGSATGCVVGGGWMAAKPVENLHDTYPIENTETLSQRGRAPVRATTTTLAHGGQGYEPQQSPPFVGEWGVE